MRVIAQIIGVGAMLALFLSYQQKKRGRLIIFKLIADALWAAHYLLLGGYGGMIPNLVGIFREVVFYKRESLKKLNNPLVPLFFIALNWAIGAFTFTQPLNIIPIIASTFVTISLWVKSPRLTKIISLPVSAAFLAYDMIIGSPVGVINQVLSIISIVISLIKEKNMKNIFTPDHPTAKPEIIIDGAKISNPAAIIDLNDYAQNTINAGDKFSQQIEQNFISDFEKKGVDKMAHVSTFKLIDGTIYVSYYANTAEGKEDPESQTARLAYCPENDTSNVTYLDVQSAGDTLCGQKITMVYDTILAQADEQTLLVLWTARVGETYYRLYRPFDVKTKTLGKIGVNRFKVGEITNDFSSSGIISALSENGIGHKKMYSDIGIMQKFTFRIENGVKYYYSGAYSGDHNMLIKSYDFITWEYVSTPDFPNASKWENAVYCLNGKCYYFVRQQDDEKFGFLTAFDLDKNKWDEPVLITDCQSRSDFILYDGELYLFHAPVDREHIGAVRIDTDEISKSKPVMLANMRGSCFYPFVDHYRGDELALSYTVLRRNIRLAKFNFKEIWG